ncbi:hypothetical protein [Streptosporangium roseum]|uniref:hypothetical protein n=1 Tax=Streptosporangium roseum TaxID=2001 RepID=UPI003331C69F
MTSTPMALQVSMRIGKELNPHGAPTYRLEPISIGIGGRDLTVRSQRSVTR